MKLSDIKSATSAAEKEAEATPVFEIVQEVNPPALFEEKSAAHAVIGRIRDAALAIVADADTEAGRKELRSVAYAVARCKTTMDGWGKDFVADLKAQAAAIDKTRKYIRDTLDETKSEVLAPVTNWENKLRAVEERIESIRSLSDIRHGESAAQIQARLNRLDYLDGEEIDSLGRDDDLLTESETARRSITIALEERTRYEADQAELARLREEKVKRDAEDAARKAEEARIAREQEIAKAAAERARLAAEKRAKDAEERANKVEAAANTIPHPPSTIHNSSFIIHNSSSVPRAIEDALMDQIPWMMPNQAHDIASAICSGHLPHVEVQL
jgi:hypothetical protein